MEAESEMSLIERIEEMPSDCVVEEWKSGRVEGEGRMMVGEHWQLEDVE